jgi:hypothetical protein
MDGEHGRPSPPDDRGDRDRDGNGDRSLSSGTIVAGLIILVLALVGGYLLVMKLIDISREEDCLASGRRNCLPIEMPRR